MLKLFVPQMSIVAHPKCSITHTGSCFISMWLTWLKSASISVPNRMTRIFLLITGLQLPQHLIKSDEWMNEWMNDWRSRLHSATDNCFAPAHNRLIMALSASIAGLEGWNNSHNNTSYDKGVKPVSLICDYSFNLTMATFLFHRCTNIPSAITLDFYLPTS